MDKNLKRQLKSAFSAPTPTQKTSFINNIPYPKTTNLDFFITQIAYIRKRFWFLSFLLIPTMCYLVRGDSVLITSSFLPFLVVLSVLEISKSHSYNMLEMEMSCRYNLEKVTLVRLSLIGSFHFIILTIVLLVFASKSEFSFFRFAIYVLTPFLICSYISLFITNHCKSNNVTYICASVSGFVAIGTTLLSNNFYTEQFLLLWTMVFILISVLLVVEIKNLIKHTEELQWNLALTA